MDAKPCSAPGSCSRRALKMPATAVDALKEHRRRQAAERLQAGTAWQNNDLVFCREDGTPLDRWHVRKQFAKITKAAGLGERWAPRELRHSFVSILSASGVPIEDISDLVGHSGTSVTETVYRHEIRPALTTGAEAMDEILKKKRATHRPSCHTETGNLKLETEWLPVWLPKIEKGPRARTRNPF
jgi:integrase